MRIMHLRSSDLFGSPERLIIGQCRYIKDHQFVAASFVSADQDSRFLSECKKAGVDTLAVPDSFPGDLRIAGHLERLIAENKIDLVVTHDYKSSFYAYMALRRGSARQIGYFHGVTSEDWKVKLYNAVDRWVLKRLKQVITVSGATKKRLVGFGLSESSVRVVPNGIDDSLVLDEPFVRDSERKPFRMIAAGRLSHEKGLDILITAIGAINQDRPSPIVLDIYGAGPEEKNIRELVDNFKLTDIVHFHGFVSDIVPHLKESDLLVMPSRSEGMPVTILEAWSQALPVLAASVGGVPELITDNLDGYLVEPENVDALANRITDIIKERSSLAAVGIAGWKRVREQYTYSRQAELLTPIYGSYE